MLRSSASRRMRRASSALSFSSSPAAGSSSITTDGPDATVRAMPTSRRRPYGQLLGRLVEVRLELELAHRGHRGGRQVVVTGPEEVGDPRQPRGALVAPGPDVLLDADVLEQLERLERAPQPETSPLRRVQPVDAATVERDRSAG